MAQLQPEDVAFSERNFRVGLNRTFLQALAAKHTEKARKIFVQLLQIPVSSGEAIATDPEFPTPIGYYETTLEWLQQQGLAETHYHPVFPDSELPLRSPHTPDVEVHPSFRFGGSVPLPASFVATIPGGRYAIEDMEKVAAIAPDNKILGMCRHFPPFLVPDTPMPMSDIIRYWIGRRCHLLSILMARWRFWRGCRTQSIFTGCWMCCRDGSCCDGQGLILPRWIIF
ncbi:hypothetical protein HC928_09045 [bacterium]|nr:hypothetical protein [bacterium]